MTAHWLHTAGPFIGALVAVGAFKLQALPASSENG